MAQRREIPDQNQTNPQLIINPPLKRRLLPRVTLLAMVVVVFLVGYFLFYNAPQKLTDSPNLSATTTPPAQTTFTISGRILMYHYVRIVDPTVDPVGYRLSVTPAQLDSELKYLRSLGYHPISMADIAHGNHDAKGVVLSFDDGYADFYTTAYPILQADGWTATLYIITGKIGEIGYMTAAQLQELDRAGFEIGAHTVNHVDLAAQSVARQQSEILGSQTTLEKLLGHSVTTFAYPSGEYSSITERLLWQAGFKTAVTTHEGILTSNSTDMLALPRIRVAPGLSLGTIKNELLGMFPTPTSLPSSSPTRQPTSTPTPTPSATPTVAPAATLIPTSSPTPTPTAG